MKPVRILLVTAGMVVVVCAVGLTVALSSAFQRWAVRRATADRPGLKVEVAGVSAGFSALHLRGVQVQKKGLRVKVDRLDADYSLWQLLFDHRLQIHRLDSRGILVDVSRYSRAGAQAAGAPAAAPGLLAHLELPVELVLDDCHVEGRILMHGATKPPVQADFKITGGRFAPGREGSLLLAATVTNPAADAGVAALNAQISLRATQTFRRSFSRIGLTAVVDAEGRIFSEQNRLRISAELAKGPAGENYSISIDTFIRGVAENLLAANAALAASQKQYVGQWTLKARSAQLEPFLLGGSLPDFEARGEGRFAFTPSTRAVSMQGNIEAGASRLEALKPAWRAIGQVRLQSQFDLAVAEGVASLRQLDVRVAGAQPVFELQATRAAEFNFNENRLRLGGAVNGDVMKLKLSGLPVAWLQPFMGSVDVSGGTITGNFTVTAEPDRLLLHAEQPLRVDQLTVVQDGEILLTNADVSLNADASLTPKELRANVSAFTLQTPVGDSLTMQGTVVMPLDAERSYAVKGSCDADLPELLGRWLPIGPIKVAGESDLTFSGARIDFRRFDARVSDPSGGSLIHAATLRPFSFDVAALRATTGGTGAVELMGFNLGHIPLDHLPLNQPGASLGGVVEKGEFVLTADGDKLILRSVSPVKLTGVSLAQDGRPAVTGLTIEAAPVFEQTGASASSGKSGDVTVRDAAGIAMLTLNADVTEAPGTGFHGTMNFNVDLPALTSQPLFDRTQAVSQGRASGEIRLAIGGTTQVEARMTVNGLVARESGQTLPVANLSFRGVVQPDGKISLLAPLLLDRAGQRSDLNFSLDLSPAGRAFDLDGKLTGEHVELADAASILGVFVASGAKPAVPAVQAAPSADVTADVAPAWSRFKGRLQVDLKTASAGKDWSMTGLAGLLSIEPSRVSLSKLEAAFGEKSRFSAKGEINFTAGRLPYGLKGDVSLTNFDTGKFFKAIDPAKPPTVEGLFTVAGHFDSRGATLEQTFDRSHGRFELSGGQGIFRGLQRTTNRVSMTSKAVELGTSMLGSIFGSDKVAKVAEKVAGQAYFVDQLAQSLGELNYDQLGVRLVRDDSLNLKLEDFTLISPEIRLSGKGTISFAPDKRLLEQPLELSLMIAGRGKIEQLLGKLRLLDGTRDELGYARSQWPITVSGTLARPDPSAYFTKVATSKLSELIAPDN